MRQIHINDLLKHSEDINLSGTIYTEISPELMAALVKQGWIDRAQRPDHKFVFFYYRQGKKILSFDRDDGFIAVSESRYEKIEVIGYNKKIESKIKPYNRFDYVDLD